MTTDTTASPEIGLQIQIGDSLTNYHDHGNGAGTPILFIHGSGPGVTAWANWRGVIPTIAEHRRVIAPDMLGFGYTSCPPTKTLDLNAWVAQLIDLLNALDIPLVSVVGNSFGGAIALALADRYPDRIDRLVLMGAVGLSFPISPGLEKVWGYQPSISAMQDLMHTFAYNHDLITDDLVAMRYTASIRDDVQSRFQQLFPEPRQKGVEMLALSKAALTKLPHQTLIIHGRDDQVIPLSVSERMLRLIPHADLHVFGECGHWVQIEKAQAFTDLLKNFLCHQN